MHAARRKPPSSTCIEPPAVDYSGAFSRGLASARQFDLMPATEAAALLEELLSLPAEERIPRAGSDERFQHSAVVEQVARRAMREAQHPSPNDQRHTPKPPNLGELAFIGSLLLPLCDPPLPRPLFYDYFATFKALVALVEIRSEPDRAEYNLAAGFALAAEGSGDPLVHALLYHVAGLIPDS